MEQKTVYLPSHSIIVTTSGGWDWFCHHFTDVEMRPRVSLATRPRPRFPGYAAMVTDPSGSSDCRAGTGSRCSRLAFQHTRELESRSEARHLHAAHEALKVSHSGLLADPSLTANESTQQIV